MKIIIATIKSWNIKHAQGLKDAWEGKHDVKIITEKEEICDSVLHEFKPDYVFFPHWSYIIPEEIYERYKCIVFHMTDLPFGRGGSPLQNLILRGFEETKISAIQVVKELDSGPIYMKESLSLEGRAEDIFKRASNIIFKIMIPKLLDGDREPQMQEGIPVTFKRRKASESRLEEQFDLKQIYDYIRMLDAEGYPNAFIDFGGHRLEFDNAVFDGEKVCANVTFRRRNHG